MARGEARWAVGTFAEQNFGIEVAGARVVDQAVLQAVEFVTRVENGLMDHRIFAGRNVIVRIFE